MTKKKDFKKELDDNIDFSQLRGLGIAPLGTTISGATTTGLSPSFPISGHFVDQSLLNESYKREIGGQIPLFRSILNVMLKNDIEEDNTAGLIVAGLNLDRNEDKLVSAIMRLLYKKSDGKEWGNNPSDRQSYGGQIKDYPKLLIKPRQLYKEYTGKDNPSGREVEIVNKYLVKLSTKKRLLIYKRTYIENKKKKIDRVEAYQPLITYYKGYKGLTPEEDAKIDKGEGYRGEKDLLLITLSPIFIDQIDSKKIFFPMDMEEQYIEAVGGNKNKVTELIRSLHKNILTMKSGTQYPYKEINELKVIYQGGLQKEYKKNKGRVETKVEEAFKAMVKMKAISKYEKLTNGKGEPKYRYYF